MIIGDPLLSVVCSLDALPLAFDVDVDDEAQAAAVRPPLFLPIKSLLYYDVFFVWRAFLRRH